MPKVFVLSGAPPVSVFVGHGPSNALRIRNIPVDATAPVDGQALVYDGTSYVPTDIADQAELDAHLADLDNPHAVTKAQVGLSAVENTALSTWTGTANITTVGQSAVTAHQAALSIAETQIPNGTLLARVADAEEVTGLWSFAHASGLKADALTERTPAAGITVDGLLVKDGSLPSWAGSTALTTLGTVETGTWSATAIAPTKGGTGLTAWALGDVPYASAENVLSALPGNVSTTRMFLRQVGDGALSAAPAWDTVTKADVGLGSVENTALSTWAGTSNITTVGVTAVTAHQGSLAIAWGQLTSVPSTFAPSAHTHPASEVTAGTFTAGTYSFLGSTVTTLGTVSGGALTGVTVENSAIGAVTPSSGKFTTLEATTSLTLPLLTVSGTAPSVRWYETDGTANVRRYRQTLNADVWSLTRYNDAESYFVTLLEFTSTPVAYLGWPVSIGASSAGEQALVSATPRLTVSGATTSASGSATQLSVAGSLTAAANSAVLYGARISATYASGGFATTVAYGLKIEDVSGAATNVALQTGVGDVVFGGWLSLAAATTAAASANIPHGTAPTAPVNGDLWTTTAGLFGRIDGATKQFATATFAADIASTTTGVMFSSQVVLRYVAPRAITLADDFAGSRLKAGTSATAETVLVVKVNGSSVGTITVAAAGTTGTFTTTGGAVSLAAGDVLTVECPSLADATLADVSITFAGTATSTSGSYDVAGYWEGVLTDDAVVVRVVSVREFVVTDSSQLAAGTAATAETVLDVQVDGVSVGSVTVAIAGDTGTFALSGGAASVEAGSVLTLVGPATADVTLADLSVTFKGTEVAA